MCGWPGQWPLMGRGRARLAPVHRASLRRIVGFEPLLGDVPRRVPLVGSQEGEPVSWSPGKRPCSPNPACVPCAGHSLAWVGASHQRLCLQREGDRLGPSTPRGGVSLGHLLLGVRGDSPDLTCSPSMLHLVQCRWCNNFKSHLQTLHCRLMSWCNAHKHACHVLYTSAFQVKYIFRDSTTARREERGRRSLRKTASQRPAGGPSPCASSCALQRSRSRGNAGPGQAPGPEKTLCNRNWFV